MFENYSPHQLRKAIEIELQYTSDVQTAAKIAMARLKKDPAYYDDKELYKAKDISKLTKKIITDKRGHKKTVYVKTEVQEKES